MSVLPSGGDPPEPRLNPQQKQQPNALEPLGWNARLIEAFAPLAVQGLVPGRVARVDRGMQQVVVPAGVWRAEPSREPEEPSATGDWVAVRPAGDRPLATIEVVLPRSSALVRGRASRGEASGTAQVIAANVDTVFVVHAADRELRARRVEREVAQVWESGAEPVVVLTRIDLVDDGEPAAEEIRALAPGVTVLLASGIRGDGVDVLGRYARGNRTLALIGASGVGKSTLANRLLGEDVLDTGEQSAAGRMRRFGRGQHTTTARHLLALPGGGALIDTPGLRSFGVWDAAEGVAATFPEIAELAQQCRFGDCHHASEPGCAVREAAEGGSLDADRLDSYRTLERELEHEELKHSKQARAGRRKQAQAFGRWRKRGSRGQIDW